MPIYHARRFVPVSTSLDRDVLRALEHLQVALDAHGAACAIRRELPFSGTAPIQITLSLSLQGRTIREIRQDRKTVVQGKSMSARVGLGGVRLIRKKRNKCSKQ